MNYVATSNHYEADKKRLPEDLDLQEVIGTEISALVKGEYANNTAALADGLVAGDVYSIPISADRSLLAVVVAAP